MSLEMLHLNHCRCLIRVLVLHTGRLTPCRLESVWRSIVYGATFEQVGWRRSGLGLWTPSGCRLMCSLRQTATHAPPRTPQSLSSSTVFPAISLEVRFICAWPNLTSKKACYNFHGTQGAQVRAQMCCHVSICKVESLPGLDMVNMHGH